MGNRAPSDPNPALIDRARQGDVRAQAELVEPHLATVVNWAARLCGPSSDPEDLAHEVFIVVLTRLHGLKDPNEFRSWLYGITRRVVAKHRRRAWFKRWAGPPTTESEDLRLGPGAEYAQRETSQRVQQVLDRMTANQREVLVLIDVEQRTAVEVAELLGLPENTVRSRLRLARASFARLATARGLSPDASQPELPALGGA